MYTCVVSAQVLPTTLSSYSTSAACNIDINPESLTLTLSADTSVELLSKGQIAKLTHDICQQIVPDRDTGLTADQTVQNEATQTKTQDGIKLLVPQITVEEYCQFVTDVTQPRVLIPNCSSQPNLNLKSHFNSVCSDSAVDMTIYMILIHKRLPTRKVATW